MTALPLPAPDYLPQLRRLTGEFAEVLRIADAGAPVPCCGDWRLRDLGVHLGNVHRWAAEVVRTGEVRRQAFEADPADGDLVSWYDESASVLLSVLDAAEPSDSCWHFGATPKEKAFWFRRQVHETAVHLVDASRGAGLEPALDPLVAADGVDEVMRALLPKIRRWYAPPELTATLLLRATDTGHAWLIAPAETVDDVPVARLVDTADAAATVEGSASALQLLLWKRHTTAGSGVRISGDTRVAESFLSAPLTP
ncbi:maleylpyruvate isomerase family mycothiol-dependent enzyme [Amycolatopsis sp. H20-H5]|uniref:maleylpyruvate isomerase family mycothiol-dependent enzyme n=1 Tax=Amycolatopsis sp. H20-H5 TaxID=3046309 RepID=UPI002DB5DB66|nr:maleylpyruvate isomerase family mycothiol-dependent enzyme [Amycolatopsis sp. H20-H5]MEC3979079.1 maleylpyruvate isomerase family mycothiol-dependent enzyme [Amycolatopsis sp. H20-H5]